MRARLLVAGSVAVVALALATPDPAALARRLGSPKAAERDAATRDLAGLGAEAVPALEEASRSEDPEVRARAAALLAGRRPDPQGADVAAKSRAARVLRAAFRDSGTLVEGGRADRELAEIGAASGDVLAETAREAARRGLVPGDLVLALVRHESDASIAALVDLWAAGSLLPSDAIRAGRALGARDRTADANPALRKCRDVLPSAAAPHRRAAVALFAGLARRDAEDLLLVTAGDPDPGVRAESARALGEHLPAAAAETLRELALDPSPDVRLAALEALRRVPGIPHPDPALANAEDERTDVRAAAAALLVREVTPETVATLEVLACDPSARVRAAIRRAVSDLR